MTEPRLASLRGGPPNSLRRLDTQRSRRLA